MYVSVFIFKGFNEKICIFDKDEKKNFFIPITKHQKHQEKVWVWRIVKV